MHRCNLNISVVDSWWSTQLGAPTQITSDERFALLEKTFPGMITYRPEDAPPQVDDPNHGFTIYKALGADIEETSIGSHRVVPMPLDRIETLDMPDHETSPAVAALREAIRRTKARHGRAQNSSFSGLFTIAMRLRGDDIFYDFYERPETVRRMVLVLEETLRRHLMFLKDECGDIPYFVLGSCSNCMISPDIYEEFFREGESRIAALSSYIKGRPRAMGIHHCGTRVDPYLDSYARIPELEMLEANWESDIDTAVRKMPGLKFKPMLDPIQFDEFDDSLIRTAITRLIENDAVEEIQAFDLSQFFTVEKMRRMLKVVLDYNRGHGLPGYTRFFA